MEEQKENDALKDFAEMTVNRLEKTFDLLEEQIIAWFEGKDADECMEYIADYLNNIDAVSDEADERLKDLDSPWAKKQLAKYATGMISRKMSRKK